MRGSGEPGPPRRSFARRLPQTNATLPGLSSQTAGAPGRSASRGRGHRGQGYRSRLPDEASAASAACACRLGYTRPARLGRRRGARGPRAKDAGRGVRRAGEAVGALAQLPSLGSCRCRRRRESSPVRIGESTPGSARAPPAGAVRCCCGCARARAASAMTTACASRAAGHCRPSSARGPWIRRGSCDAAHGPTADGVFLHDHGRAPFQEWLGSARRARSLPRGAGVVKAARYILAA